MPIAIAGLRDLQADLRAVEGGSVREITAQLKVGAKEITAATKANIHSVTGALSADARPYATAKAAGVRFTLPYAPVQEFARNWVRHNKGSGGTPLSAAAKRRHFGSLAAGGSGAGGTNTVHYQGDTPRFAHKAINELGPKLIDDTFDRLVDNVLKAHGWFG